MVTALLDNGADPTISDSNNDNALHYAMGRGFVRIGVVLARYGVNLDSKNLDDKTPVDLMPPKFKRADVKRRLQLKQQMQALTPSNPLVTSLANAETKMVTEKDPLVRAIQTRDLMKVRQLLVNLTQREQKLYVNAPIMQNHGRTLLFVAVNTGRQELVEILLDYMADVNHQDMLKDTPLHYACRKGHAPLIGFLIGRGADPYLRNQKDEACYHQAPKELRAATLTQINDIMISRMGGEATAEEAGAAVGGGAKAAHAIQRDVLADDHQLLYGSKSGNTHNQIQRSVEDLSDPHKRVDLVNRPDRHGRYCLGYACQVGGSGVCVCVCVF